MPRPLPYDLKNTPFKKVNTNFKKKIRIGSFGLADESKGFAELISGINENYTDIDFNFHITSSYYSDPSKLKMNKISDTELRKVKNKVISVHMFSELNVLNKAMNLATSELMGDANLVNKQIDLYEAVTSDKILTIAQDIFRKENSNTLYYHAK